MSEGSEITSLQHLSQGLQTIFRFMDVSRQMHKTCLLKRKNFYQDDGTLTSIW